MRHSTITNLALAAGLLLVLSACAPGTGDSARAASGGIVSELFLGLWHGIIAPITLIVEIINALVPKLIPWRVHLYETKATGVFYDLGFYFGIASHPIALSRSRWRWRR